MTSPQVYSSIAEASYLSEGGAMAAAQSPASQLLHSSVLSEGFYLQLERCVSIMGLLCLASPHAWPPLLP